jgi:hypothetical protein
MPISTGSGYVGSRGSAARIATGYKLDGRNFGVGAEEDQDRSAQRPHRFWRPYSTLSSG